MNARDIARALQTDQERTVRVEVLLCDLVRYLTIPVVSLAMEGGAGGDLGRGALSRMRRTLRDLDQLSDDRPFGAEIAEFESTLSHLGVSLDPDE